MQEWFQAVPGRLYVVGTLLPLAAFALLLIAGGVRARVPAVPASRAGFAASIYWVCGGDNAAEDRRLFRHRLHGRRGRDWRHRTGDVPERSSDRRGTRRRAGPNASTGSASARSMPLPSSGKSNTTNDPSRPAPPTALALELGYKIDHLTAVVFAMVTVISTLIFVFSLGYMQDETRKMVEDHEVERH